MPESVPSLGSILDKMNSTPSTAEEVFDQESKKTVNIPSYTTILTSEEEKTFQKWVKETEKTLGRPLGIDEPDSYYDYRGFWKAIQDKDPNTAMVVDPVHKDVHFPDTWKQPGHPTFSIESRYYQPGMRAGYWKDNEYIPIPGWEDFDTYNRLFGLEKNEGLVTPVEPLEKILLEDLL